MSILERTFLKACKNGGVEYMKHLLIYEKINPSCFHDLPIIYACDNGHTEIVKILLNAGVDPSTHENHMILSTTAYGHIDILEMILKDTRVDPSVNDNDGILNAVIQFQGGKFLSIEEMIYGKKAKNYDIESKKFFSMVEMLLKDGRTDPTTRDNNCIRWADYHANYTKDRRLVELLESYGCKL